MLIKILKKLSIALLFVSPFCVHAYNAAEVYDRVSDSIFTIYSYDPESKHQEALGSGVAVQTDVIATNCHVAQLGEFRIKIENKFKKGVLSFQDYRHDLCLIKVADATLKPVKLRDSFSVDIGEDVYAVGNPHGLEKSISRGIISNKFDFKHGSVLQTDATISLGSSGGGLFDKDANLIGITRAGHRFKDIAFTIPTEWIEVVLSGKKPKWLPDKKIILQELGQFGKDKISLYRYDGNCFLYFLGYGLSDRDQGSMMWFPKQKNKIFFLPLITDVKDAVLTLIEEGVDLSITTQDFVIEKPEFNPIIQPTELVVESLDYDPIRRFQSGRDVTMHYSDVYHQRLSVSMQFGLLGFTQALKSYYKLCIGDDSMQ